MSRKPSSPYEVGESIGSGSYKSCYKVPKNRVALVHHYGEDEPDHTIQEEFQMLLRLKRFGIPVPDTHVGHVLVSGKKTEALIMPSYPYHNRDVDLWDHVNKQMLTDLEGVYLTLKKKQLEIYDLQFLFDKRGNVVVTDPLDIWTGVKLSDNESTAKIANTIGEFRKGCRFKTRLTELDFDIASNVTDESL